MPDAEPFLAQWGERRAQEEASGDESPGSVRDGSALTVMARGRRSSSDVTERGGLSLNSTTDAERMS